MPKPLMPKATAVWLVESTTLTFEQIAAFCEMHTLEVQAIADGEVAANIVGLDPVASGQLTAAEIERCTKDSSARMQMAVSDLPEARPRPKGARYTPVSKRQDRPDAIAWLLRNHPQLSDPQICKLVGTTKTTIKAVRENTHWNAPNIKPRDPVTLGLCTQTDLNAAVALADSRKPEAPPAEPPAAAHEEAATPDETAPEAAGSEEAAPEAAAPEAAGSEEAAPEETGSEEAAPEAAAPEGTGSDETAPEEAAPEEAGSNEAAPGEAAPEETAAAEPEPPQNESGDSALQGTDPEDSEPETAPPSGG